MSKRKKTKVQMRKPIASVACNLASAISTQSVNQPNEQKGQRDDREIGPKSDPPSSKRHILEHARCAEPLINIVATMSMVFIAICSYLVSASQDRTSKMQGENQLRMNTQSSQSATALAKYAEIRDILLASDSSPQGQIFALHRFAEVMKAQVPELGPKGVRIVYPNVKPMRTLIHQFLRAERDSKNSVYSRPLASVSDELIKLLSKLGRSPRELEATAIWDLETKSSPVIVGSLAAQPNSSKSNFDLSYLKPDFFVGSQLPFLFQFKGSPSIVFPEGADFGSANFYHSNLSGCSFKRATFRSADLRNADFRGADLTGATFEDAKLEGANFEGAIGYEAPSSLKQRGADD